ncbi:MAG: glycerol kinase GlpK [Pseudobdellovibrionaceae bacterium]|nr:glycerol kinase GlpK [Bdellovibrionales bacterium]USN46168.1 MAG: glycerol kinase GlpK [Pseudobdellovibrionaceae bacterium]
MSKYILSIDQGTTGTTVAIINQRGLPKAKVNKEFRQHYPKPGWVEHNPEDIWDSVLTCIRQVLDEAQIRGEEIAGIGITNQRETTLIWERETGKPIHNAIVWQCRRTTEFCQGLKKKGLEKYIKRKTGLVIDPYFSSSKFRWLLENATGARKKAQSGQLAGGTIDSFLFWRLTAGASHKTDVSNASRTQLMDIKSGEWDKELLKIFSVPENLLPEICPSSGELGQTKNVPGLPDGIPISGMAGDQQAALFGQSCFKMGEAKCTFGTGSFILMNTGNEKVTSKHGLLTSVAWQLKNQKKFTYALEGGAFICGAAVQWLRDEMQFFKSSAEIEQLASQVESAEGVEFVPALAGLGAPYWSPEARGAITGLTRGSNRSHIARATLDAMALQNVDILVAMEKDLGKKLKNLKVDGGASANNLLMQLQADYLGAKIYRPRLIETTVAGAAYLAGLGIGYWSSEKDIKEIWQVDQGFQPKITAKQQTARLKSWHKAIKTVI